MHVFDRAAPEPQPVSVFIEEQAARTPQRIALRVGGTALTYAWLNRRANQLSRHLRMVGVGPETVMSVCLRRDERLVITLLAILKAGGAYLPLDGEHPAGRLSYMHENATAIGVVTDDKSQEPAAQLHVPTVNLDKLDLGNYPDGDISIKPGLADLAYVLYTSGSTGRPKGVMVEHRNLANYLILATGDTRITEQDCVPQIVSQSFDPSIREMLSPLLVGGSLLMLPDREQRTPEALAATFASGQVTAILAVVPSLLTEVLAAAEEMDQDWPLRLVATAGEQLTGDIASRLQRRIGDGIIVNQYGPTECTMISARWTYDPKLATPGALPIGKPIANVKIILCDPAGRPVPSGESGEIYVSGAGVSRGYVGDQDRTRESFQVAEAGAARGYRTGDLARLLPDGNLLFLGRRDRQVKIRGVRVEPAEVESALRRLPSVRNAAATTAVSGGSTRLVASIATRGSEVPSVQLLNEALLKTLPREMVPAEYRWIPDFPLTTSGKIDRARLSPDLGRSLKAPQPGAPQSPDGPLRAISAIWEEVLDVPAVSEHDRFLDLGGDSLMAARVAARIRGDLGVDITSAVMLGNPTAGDLIGLLATSGDPPTPLLPPQRPRLIPLSAAQQRLWLIDQMNVPRGLYNQPVAFRLSGSLDRPALDQAFRQLVERHEVLRTVIGMEAGSPHQVILPPSQSSPAIQVRQARPPTESADDLLLRLALEGFDLSADLPIRVYLITGKPDSSVLLLVLHHIVTDAWSKEQLLRELFAAYGSLREGREGSIPDSPLQYADYTLWEAQQYRPGSAAFEGDRQFWHQELAGIPNVLELPASRLRPAYPSHLGDHVTDMLAPSMLAALRELATREHATLFMVLHAAIACLLARMGAGVDILMGTPVANRTDPRFEEVLGLFANTVVLRTDLSGRPSFSELIARVRTSNIGAYTHQRYPFDQLVTDLNPLRTLSVNPLFQVMITLDRDIVPPENIADLALEALPLRLPRAKFDLLFGFTETTPGTSGSGLAVTVEFSTDLFDRAAIAQMGTRLRLLLHAVTRAPDSPIADLDILTPADIGLIRSATEGQVARWPGTSIPDQIAAHAARTPGAPAVRYEGTEITFQELVQQSEKLALLMRAHGIGPEKIVAVALPRSIDLPVALLAILRVGAVYMPIDLTYPSPRITAMLGDARPASVITYRRHMTDFAETGSFLIFLDDQATVNALRAIGPGTQAEASIALGAGPGRGGYVVYTSGSTGHPKGIVMTVEGLTNLINWHVAHLSDRNRQRSAQFTSLGFDMAIQELLAPLAAGHCLVLPTDSLRRDIHGLIDWLNDNQVNELYAPSSAIQAIIETAAERAESLPSLTAVFQGGEAFAMDQNLRSFSVGRAIYNLYGPAETHAATSYRIPADSAQAAGAVPIGRPIANSTCYLLDSALHPVPAGSIGELYLGGPQVARGYLHRPALTASRFVADPFRNDGYRMYRTGDLARLRSDGELEFIRRADNQVKIRGFRVELGEIEAALIRHPYVVQAAVVAVNDRLSAYVSLAAGQLAEITDLRDHVASLLPEYMVPSAFTILDKLPYSPNGKLDRMALLSIEEQAPPRATQPIIPIEELLCEIFAEALGVPHVTPVDSFFDLGGHSITAARLLSRVHHIVGAELTMRDIFEAPTARRLVPRLTVGQSGPDDSDYLPVLPLRTGGSLAPLFCVHPAVGLAWSYSGLLRHLHDRRPVYGLQSPAFVRGATADGIRELAAVYTDQVLAVRPTGAFHLIGWSYGGLLAHAIATELHSRGHQVGLLGLLDAYPKDPVAQGETTIPTKHEVFAQLLSSLGYESDSRSLGFGELVARLRSVDGPLSSIPAVRIPTVVRIFAAHIRHMTGYVPPVFEGDLTVWRAALDVLGRPLAPREERWRRFATGLVTELAVDVSHGRMGFTEGWDIIGPQLADLISHYQE
jgi:amino acid adenylation domain-containing protein